MVYHKTTCDDSICGSTTLSLSSLCRMRKESDPEHGRAIWLRPPPRCRYKSNVPLEGSTETRRHLHVEHCLRRRSRGHYEDFETLNDVGKKTNVWRVIGMKCNMTITKQIGIHKLHRREHASRRVLAMNCFR